MTFDELMDSFYINDDLCNKKVYIRLSDQMKRDRIVPVIGAGLSIWAEYPLWAKLLLEKAEGMPANIKTEIQEQVSNGEYEKAATKVEEFYHRNAFLNTLRDTFSTEKLDTHTRPEYQKLIPLLFKGPIVTTNYDKSLERIFRDPFVITPESDFHSHEIKNRITLFKPFIMKLHGTIDDPEHMILTESSYNRVYGDNPAIPDLTLPLPGALQSVFNAAPPLFLGCGLGPDRTCAVLKACYGTTGYALLELPEETENKTDPFHPVLTDEKGRIPALEKRLEFLDGLGLEVIWYPKGQHEAVEVLLKQLAEDTGVSYSSTESLYTRDTNGGQEMDKVTVFLSYNSKDVPVADIIKTELKAKLGDKINISVYTELHYRDSFRAFMNTIQDHDYVICIVSDHYLKSKPCMYEVGEVIKDRRYTDRLFFVVISEEDKKYYTEHEDNFAAANLYGSALMRMEYTEYWMNEYNKLQEKLKEIKDIEAIGKYTNDLYEIGKIYRHDIGEFIEYLSDHKGLKLSEHIKEDFSELIEQMFK